MRSSSLAMPDIVLERIFFAARIEDIAGIADGGFAKTAGLPHRFHRDTHIGKPVQRIEDAEDVDALRGRFEDELATTLSG